MEFKTIVESRYATKKFDGNSIDEEKIEELKELIRLSPSSFNIQPWKVKIITDKKTKEHLFPHAWNQEQITSCSHLFVFCADTRISHLIDELEKAMIANGAKKESIAGYIKMMKDFDKGLSKEQKLAWAQRQTYLALENALLGAKALGFDSCPMEGFNQVEFAKILKLPEYLVPTVLCPVGFASDTPRAKVRFSAKDIFF